MSRGQTRPWDQFLKACTELKKFSKKGKTPSEADLKAELAVLERLIGKEELWRAAPALLVKRLRRTKKLLGIACRVKAMADYSYTLEETRRAAAVAALERAKSREAIRASGTDYLVMLRDKLDDELRRRALRGEESPGYICAADKLPIGETKARREGEVLVYQIGPLVSTDPLELRFVRHPDVDLYRQVLADDVAQGDAPSESAVLAELAADTETQEKGDEEANETSEPEPTPGESAPPPPPGEAPPPDLEPDDKALDGWRKNFNRRARLFMAARAAGFSHRLMGSMVGLSAEQVQALEDHETGRLAWQDDDIVNRLESGIGLDPGDLLQDDPPTWIPGDGWGL